MPQVQVLQHQKKRETDERQRVEYIGKIKFSITTTCSKKERGGSNKGSRGTGDKGRAQFNTLDHGVHPPTSINKKDGVSTCNEKNIPARRKYDEEGQEEKETYVRP